MSLARPSAGGAPRLRRGALAAAALALSLTGCAAGNNAQSLGVKPDNAATAVGDIKIQNAVVVTLPEGEGPATVIAKIFNDGSTAQTLEALRVTGSGSPVKLSPAEGSGPLTVPAGGSLQLGGEGNASAVVEGGEESLRDGDAQRVVFDFSRTGEVPLNALVVPAEGYYEGYGPSQSASPSPSDPASPGASPSGSPSGSPTGSPGAGDSESPEADGSEEAVDAEAGAPAEGAEG